MSNVACVDEYRKKTVYAKDAAEQDRNTIYFCPNKNCNALLKICSIDGLRRAYFRMSDKKHGHIENCPYGSNIVSNTDFYKNDEKKFDFEKAIKNMLHIKNQNSNYRNITYIKNYNSSNSSKPISTIKQIYAMCKNINVRDKYADIEIYKMLVDNRSMFFYKKGIYGYKIVECYIKNEEHYDAENKEIGLHTGIYNLILQFKEDSLFNSIKNTIKNNKQKTIIVSGYWETKKNDGKKCCTTTIMTKKQVTVLNKNYFRNTSYKG